MDLEKPDTLIIQFSKEALATNIKFSNGLPFILQSIQFHQIHFHNNSNYPLACSGFESVPAMNRLLFFSLLHRQQLEVLSDNNTRQHLDNFLYVALYFFFFFQFVVMFLENETIHSSLLENQLVIIQSHHQILICQRLVRIVTY